jgi:hypothetical protein
LYVKRAVLLLQSNLYLTIAFGTNELEAQWAEPVLLTFRSVLRKLYTEPSIGASYQISVHLAAWFQRRRFLEKSTNQKQELPMVAIFVN